ncbi:PPOX class F420-dependent oxidoreductase [Mycobacterium spongiae]|uniref:TIGR03618 family F420-dependent PPOX class oxidoreductase n=1 Tax=Mycobacterium spongiae TaxID=886343 RepID=A0A975JYV8_9MYCO|nr:PPOX class F420-dependent oxidoreductase [Mycobacterium spongiae]QUR68250.1 TIGR03618 family F420-dependent PPOX class oxidoreductase [Mycobacterium spongiae]
MADLSSRVAAFLSEGTRTGMLGFVAADGRPLVTPVWFVVDNTDLVFTTALHSPKVLALQRDSRVVICVDDPHPPYSFVQVQGVATVTEDPHQVLDIATRAGARYMGAARAAEFGHRNAVPGEVAVRVHPTKVISAFNVSD